MKTEKVSLTARRRISGGKADGAEVFLNSACPNDALIDFPSELQEQLRREAYWRGGNLQTPTNGLFPSFPVRCAYQTRLLFLGSQTLKARLRHLGSLLRRPGYLLAMRARYRRLRLCQARGQNLEPKFYWWLGEGRSIALAEPAKRRASLGEERSVGRASFAPNNELRELLNL